MSALVFPKATTAGPLTATDPVELRAAAILTSDYVPSAAVNVMGLSGVVPSLVFTKGSLTSLRIMYEGFDGTNWQPFPFKATQSGGYSAVTSDLLEISADYTGALPSARTVGFQQFRVSLIGNGTATSSSAAVSCGGYLNPVYQ